MAYQAKMTHEQRRLRREAIRRERLEEGTSLDELAHKYGVSHAWCALVCRNAPPAGREGAPKPSNYALIAALVNTADPLRRIARQHGVGVRRVEHVYHRLLQAGAFIPARRRGRPKA